MCLNENQKTDIDYAKNIVKIRETKSLRQSDLQADRTFVFREILLLPQIEALKFPLTKVKKQTVNKN
jgi:hypothetical protein